jgi:hypothetical protein
MKKGDASITKKIFFEFLSPNMDQQGHKLSFLKKLSLFQRLFQRSESVAGDICQCFFDNVIHPVSKFFNGIFRAARLAA